MLFVEVLLDQYYAIHATLPDIIRAVMVHGSRSSDLLHIAVCLPPQAQRRRNARDKMYRVAFLDVERARSTTPILGDEQESFATNTVLNVYLYRINIVLTLKVVAIVGLRADS